MTNSSGRPREGKVHDLVIKNTLLTEDMLVVIEAMASLLIGFHNV